ncbi:unnamed protein product [Ixodes pacificus]
MSAACGRCEMHVKGYVRSACVCSRVGWISEVRADAPLAAPLTTRNIPKDAPPTKDNPPLFFAQFAIGACVAENLASVRQKNPIMICAQPRVSHEAAQVRKFSRQI